MKADVLNLDGKKLKTIELPEQFNEDYEPDLIKRAAIVIENNRRMPYGTLPLAGQGYSAKLSRRRRDYKGAYGKGISRVPRKTMWKRGTQFSWVGALAPGTRGGRRAHPPKASKDWTQKINTKERKKAIRSALSGLITTDNLVILDNKFETLKKLKEVKGVLQIIGMAVDAIKRNRAGKGKSRGRRIRYKVNALVVVAGECSLINSIRNIPGYSVIEARNLNADVLTLNHDKLKKCLFTEAAIEKINKEKLFMVKK